MVAVQSIEIIGAHPVVISEQEFNSAVAALWGNGLTGIERENAEKNVKEHFDDLYLIEIKVNPSDAMVDWDMIGQASGLE